MPAREITKVLIANRGEIACRVIRACRELDLRTVAVHSDADAAALHVRLADEAVAIGPPPARESYLRADKIVDAIKKTGADAVHPGYGFLSENADFAEAVAAAGATFIGPPPAAIRAMGGKTSARALMQARGRAGRPRRQRRGRARVRRRAAAAKAAAARIGYPVMLKAAAGGGGRGMRLVDGEDKLEAALAGAQREAKARVRRRHHLPREGDRPAAPHRDPGVRRRARQRRPPVRARLLDPAPQPEGDRGVAVARDRRRAARADGRGRGARGALGRLRRRRHDRVALRRGGAQLLLPRDEHAPAGRAPDHRAGDRRRSGALADRASRRASAAARAGGDPAARRRHRVPRLRRGSGEVPAVARDDHVAARAVGPGRARRLRRRRGQRHLRPLRPDDLEAGGVGRHARARRSSACAARSASTTSAASARTWRSTAR